MRAVGRHIMGVFAPTPQPTRLTRILDGQAMAAISTTILMAASIERSHSVRPLGCNRFQITLYSVGAIPPSISKSAMPCRRCWPIRSPGHCPTVVIS